MIPGNADDNPVVVQEIGRVAAGILLRLLADKKPHTVAVTGGTTVAAMAEKHLWQGTGSDHCPGPWWAGGSHRAPGQYDCYGSCTQTEDQVPSALRAR